MYEHLYEFKFFLVPCEYLFPKLEMYRATEKGWDNVSENKNKIE